MTSRTRQIRRIVGGEGKANESEALGMERGCAAQPPCWQRASHRSATRTRLAYFFVLLGRWQPPRVTRAVHTPRSAAGSRQQAVGCLAHYIRPQVRTIRIDREMPTSIAALAPKIARILFGIRLYLERDPCVRASKRFILPSFFKTKKGFENIDAIYRTTLYCEHFAFQSFCKEKCLKICSIY